MRLVEDGHESTVPSVPLEDLRPEDGAQVRGLVRSEMQVDVFHAVVVPPASAIKRPARALAASDAPRRLSWNSLARCGAAGFDEVPVQTIALMQHVAGSCSEY